MAQTAPLAPCRASDTRPKLPVPSTRPTSKSSSRQHCSDRSCSRRQTAGLIWQTTAGQGGNGKRRQGCAPRKGDPAAGAWLAYPEGGGEQSCAGRFLLSPLGTGLRLRLISPLQVSTGATGAGKPGPVKARQGCSCSPAPPPCRPSGAVGRPSSLREQSGGRHPGDQLGLARPWT